ncbi:hypothetical protein BDY19DRAFT_993090 [Irpex rosettiformis]|uniref:Uncharacterized protein n=1 Tax=Irpex rosettiformis TaxID=378272 RepID=A0ACB8U5L4_9APHY|nr:hypothetical protein BDY19DRAFT_993090 [Irpex rosettiformis]
MNWSGLPTEIQRAVVDRLATHDVHAFSNTCHDAYLLALPSLYHTVSIPSPVSLHAFLTTVPLTHAIHVRSLSLNLAGATCSTATSNSLTSLLTRCTHITHFTLTTPGILKPSILPAFASLHALQVLSIKGDIHDSRPLSERLITSIVLSLPRGTLTSLSLSSITRSSLHAPNLLGTHPFIPLVSNDSDVPPHPVHGSLLSLPTLLSLSTLTHLSITDTHLGDPRWSEVPVRCTHLRVLEVGGCCFENDTTNARYAERIVGRVSRGSENLEKLVLGASVSTGIFESGDDCHSNETLDLNASLDRQGTRVIRQHTFTLLANLRTLELTALHPLEHLTSTLSTFASSSLPSSSHPHSSPSQTHNSSLEEIILECHEDDIEEYLDVLAEWVDGLLGESSFEPQLEFDGDYPMTVEDAETINEEWCLSPTSTFPLADFPHSRSRIISRAGSADSFTSSSSSSSSMGSSSCSFISSSTRTRTSISSMISTSTTDWDEEELKTPLDCHSTTSFPGGFGYGFSRCADSEEEGVVIAGTATGLTTTKPKTKTRERSLTSRFPNLRRLALYTVTDVLEDESLSRGTRKGKRKGRKVVFDLREGMVCGDAGQDDDDEEEEEEENDESEGYTSHHRRSHWEGIHDHPLVALKAYLDDVRSGSGCLRDVSEPRDLKVNMVQVPDFCSGLRGGGIEPDVVDGTTRRKAGDSVHCLGDLELGETMRVGMRDVLYEDW